jgi:hypothetical protein
MAERNISAIVQRRRLVTLPDNTEVEVRALDLCDWAMLEDEAVAVCKRSMLETYTKNMDLIPQAYREQMLQDAFKRAEDIRADNLPSVMVKVNIEGAGIQEVPMGYAHYWLRNTMRGRLFAAWLSIRKSKPAWTLNEAAEFFAEKGGDKVLDQVADAVGEVSSPTLGNE